MKQTQTAQTTQKQKKVRHNYTNEVELKSLLIRAKNKKNGVGSVHLNKRIDKYINWYQKISKQKYNTQQKREKSKRIRNNLKEKIIELSEKTQCDKESYEKFGRIILLMIEHILKKPQFSGYTWRDDFFSDATYKILRYLDNFDHVKISKRTGNKISAFAYITQIIHNSILYVINSKKKENKKINEYIKEERINSNLYYFDHFVSSEDIGGYYEDYPTEECTITRIFDLEDIDSFEDIQSNIKQIIIDNEDANEIIINCPEEFETIYEAQFLDNKDNNDNVKENIFIQSNKYGHNVESSENV